MVQFLVDKPMLWDKKLSDYKHTDVKNRVWKEQANLMGKTDSHLIGWFKGLHDGWVQIDKKQKSGAAPFDPTEREVWMRGNFSFLMKVVFHCPEPVSCVSIATYCYIY